MKKIFTLAFSMAAAMGAFAGTPTLDGTITPADGYGTAVATADGTPGWAGANSKMLYITQDDNYVYFAAEVTAWPWMTWAFIVNTKAGGGTNDSWSRKVTYNHTNKPDFTFRGTFGGYAEYHSWSGTAWSGVGASIAASEFAENINSDGANGAIEIRVPKSTIGAFSTLDVQFYVTGDRDDHGSFDAVPNDNNTTSWDPPASQTTLSNYAANITLPVKLMAFNAAKDRNVVTINWAVAQESNIDSYQVERSADGVQFTTIQTLNAANIAGTQRRYNITDARPLNGVNYYRLAINENGRVEYSSIVKVTMGGNTGQFALNYVPGKINIRLTGADAGQYAITIIGANGQAIRTMQWQHDGTEQFRSVEMPGRLSKGVYRVVLTGAGIRSTQSFLVP